MSRPGSAVLRLFAALLLLGWLGWLAACGGAPDVIYVNAEVVTMDPTLPRAQAVALAGERIVGVGTEEEMRALAGGSTRIVDLEGQALLPGFVDAHSHLSLAGQLGATMVDLRPPPIGPFDSVAAIQGALRERASTTPPGEWIVALGWDDTLLREGRRLTREDLDAVSTLHPILALHTSVHLATVNSRVLEMLGIDADTPQPPGGRIVKQPTSGEPTGVLEELPAIGPVLARIPELPLSTRIGLIERGARIYARAGVTTAQDGGVDEAGFEVLFRADAAGALPIRVVALPLPALAMKFARRELGVGFEPGSHLSLGAAKVIADGSIQAYTGYLREPYDTPAHGDPTWRGYPNLSRENLVRTVADLHEGGLQVAIHANGDAAIDDALFAIAEAQAAHPRDDARPVLIHAQMARKDQLDEMARLGVVPSFFALHIWYWGDRHRDVFLGPERAAGISPARSAGERGLPYTLHTDAPVVPMEPLRLVQAAVLRKTTGGAVLGPEERVTVEEALRAITLDAARQQFLEEGRGSITPGKLADLVVLDANPLAVDPERLHEIDVVRTIVGGETVYLR